MRADAIYRSALPARRRRGRLVGGWRQLSLTGLSILVEGAGREELGVVWSLLVESGLVAPSQLDLAGSVAGDSGCRADVPTRFGRWHLVIELGDESSTTPHVTVTPFPPDSGITRVELFHVVDAALTAAVSAGVGAMTVAAGRKAWAKFVRLFRRSGGAADDDWRNEGGYL